MYGLLAWIETGMGELNPTLVLYHGAAAATVLLVSLLTVFLMLRVTAFPIFVFGAGYLIS